MHPLLKFTARLVPSSLKQQIKDDLVRYFQAPSMELCLKNLRRLGFEPSSIIDVGAYVGEWSMLAHGIFPQASILMIEAQQSKESKLSAISRAHPRRIQHRIALLGPEMRENVVFHECEAAPTASSVLTSRESLDFHEVRRRMETLDSVLESAGLGKPDFLKLDVQGYELEVLKGAPKTLATAEVILLEVSTLEMYEGAPLFHSVIAFMHDHAFRVFDIPTLMRVHGEDTLVQVDAIFVKETSPLIASAIKQL